MRARLGLARALIAEPPVLLLDEPARSLDPVAAADLRTVLRRLSAEGGTAVLYATHDLHDAAEVAARTIGLGAGQGGVRARRGDLRRGPRARAAGAGVNLRLLPAFLRRDLAIQLSYRADFWLQSVSVLVTLILFYYVAELVDDGSLAADVEGDAGYFGFVVIGLALLRILTTGLNSFAMRLRNDQTSGTLEAVLASPVPAPMAILFSAAFDLLQGDPLRHPDGRRRGGLLRARASTRTRSACSSR